MKATDRSAVPRWTVGRARAQFAGLLKAAESAPQEIYHRRRLRAVVVDPESWRRAGAAVVTGEPPSLSEMFAEMRRIAAETGWVLPVTKRRDRPNPFLKVLARRAR
ncbi:MAG: hypothetical protein AAB368_06885 [bacterium]